MTTTRRDDAHELPGPTGAVPCPKFWRGCQCGPCVTAERQPYEWWPPRPAAQDKPTDQEPGRR